MAKLATLVDDFNGGQLDPTRWVLGQGTVEVGSGVLALDCLSTYTVVESAASFDLTGSQFTAKVIPAPLSATREFAVKLLAAGDEDNSLATIVTGEATALLLRRRVAGVSTDTYLTYDPVQHAFWRIRESAGVAYWEFSPTGTSWTIARQEVHGLSLSDVDVRIACGFWGPPSGGGAGSGDTEAPTDGVGYGYGQYGDGQYGTGELYLPTPPDELPARGYLAQVNTVAGGSGGTPQSGYGTGLYGDGSYGGQPAPTPEPTPIPTPPPPLPPPVPVVPPSPPYGDGGYGEGGYGNPTPQKAGRPQFLTKPRMKDLAGSEWIRY